MDKVKNKMFSAPTSINLEITDKCNAKCRHCYNYWRPQNILSRSMNQQQIDRLATMMQACGVFHVVLSGGEPFANFEVLVYACEKLRQDGMSISVNSNLMLATLPQLQRLRQAGADHILTSLNSCDPAVNDYLVQYKGAFTRTVAGIKAARKAGIRVSANMIINRENIDQVYNTALFAHELGCQKIFATRVVPPLNPPEGLENNAFKLSPQQIRHCLDQLISARDTTGIMIGSLVGYPLCFLKDLERYSDFVGRGCPAQAGHRMNINTDGTAHCCVHEVESYGNVFKIGIAAAYAKMQTWHNGGYRHPACRQCPWINLCSSGCRMSALGHTGNIREADPLMGSPGDIRPGAGELSAAMAIKRASLDCNLKLMVAPGLRFRPEKNFWLINIRWANTIRVESRLGKLIRQLSARRRPFNAKELGLSDYRQVWHLLYKGVLQSPDYDLPASQAMAGLSLDPSLLPEPEMEAA